VIFIQFVFGLNELLIESSRSNEGKSSFKIPAGCIFNQSRPFCTRGGMIKGWASQRPAVAQPFSKHHAAVKALYFSNSKTRLSFGWMVKS
jgi:hypothetical protein